ncbi:hypothetical protein DYB38_010992, partial [Aphanomyces astaci]
LEGKGLKALDGDGADSTSDPFVTLTLGDDTSAKPLKTKVIKKSLAPKWRQKFYFAINPATKYANTVVKLRCEDQDVFGTDFMGLVAIDVREWIQKFGGIKTDLWLKLQQVEFKHGDYQVQVRVIEVRDLVPQDANGSADPVVFVECLGETQHTAVKPNQLSCVFDHLMFFNLKDLDKDTVEGASIQVTVQDADGPFSHDKIGTFRIDVPYVYYQKNHEMYRQWVALVKSAGDSEQGVQGYLLYAII